MKDIKTVYIAGPISGKPDDNKKAFSNAEERLFMMGYSPVNPHKLNHEENHSRDWFQYMRVCISAMMQCDAIVLLDGWEDSDGAQMEIKLATSLNIPWAFMANRLEFH